MSLRVLVCGSRDWDDEQMVHSILTGLYAEDEVGHMLTEMTKFVVIEGGAKGADAAAAHWARCSPMHSHNESEDQPKFLHLRFPADWKQYGRAAGPMRNQQMLDEGKPDIVLAFKNGFGKSAVPGGTEDMVHRAKKAGVPTYVVQRA